MDRRREVTVPTQVALRFVTGKYHANGWDHALNEGISEWPPSPWRLLRALMSVWHTRCDDIPEETIDDLLTGLATEPPEYLLPDARPSQTRHYMPNPDFLEGVKHSTSLQLDPRLNLGDEAEVVIRWPNLTLPAGQRDALERLLRKLSYLGRAESRCEARLLSDEHSQHEKGWVRPSETGNTQVLVPEPGVTRKQLETSPLEMRKARLRYPSGSRWVRYELPGEVRNAPARREVNDLLRPTTVRWRLEPTAPFRVEDGILAAHGLRGRILGTKKENTDLREQGSGVEALAGHHGVFDDGPQHRHPHWLWLPTLGADGELTGQVEDLVLWVPDGIPADTLSRLAGARYLPRWSNAPKGYRSGAELHLQLMGPVDTVMHEYTSADATTWVSVTPFLTDRFPKLNKPREEFAQKLVERELGFRHPGGTPPVRAKLLADWEDRDVVRFRRYRWNESMAQRRRGMLLQLDFDEPLPKGPGERPEPLVLGSLSHFGFGLFRPVER